MHLRCIARAGSWQTTAKGVIVSGSECRMYTLSLACNLIWQCTLWHQNTPDCNNSHDFNTCICRAGNSLTGWPNKAVIIT